MKLLLLFLSCLSFFAHSMQGNKIHNFYDKFTYSSLYTSHQSGFIQVDKIYYSPYDKPKKLQEKGKKSNRAQCSVFARQQSPDQVADESDSVENDEKEESLIFGLILLLGILAKL